MSESNVSKGVVALCRRRLVKEYLPRIERCLEILSQEDIWWRAHETDNSVGNLMLHLSGNVRQWIISGIGEEPDRRKRQEEFDERHPLAKEDLLKRIADTVHEADRVLEDFDTGRLMEVRKFQKWEVTCLEAITHITEHFAQHLGQIVYITKMKKGVDLKFFDV
jgi:uncharacterized damage-inducible protein DinB